MQIQIYRLLERTKMAGPGWRFCLWVQGCSRHCEGCMAKETWPPSAGSPIELSELLRQVVVTPDIEGATFLGGEPFEQAEAISELAGHLKASGLSVVTFTGFQYEELLLLEDPNIQGLLDSTDLLIDGPFIQERFDLSRPWIGSSNQQFHFLSNRYSESDLQGIHNQIEIRIAPNGTTIVNGMGDFSKIKKLL